MKNQDIVDAILLPSTTRVQRVGFFQLRDESGSGIGKNFGFWYGSGSDSGIGIAILAIGYLITGIENLDQVFIGFLTKCSTAVFVDFLFWLL